MRSYDVLREVAKESGFSIKDTREFMRALERVVEKNLYTQDEMRLFQGLRIGTRVAPPHVYKNQHTGEMVSLPARRVPYARFGSKYKNMVKALNAKTQEAEGEAET